MTPQPPAESLQATWQRLDVDCHGGVAFFDVGVVVVRAAVVAVLGAYGDFVGVEILLTLTATVDGAAVAFLDADFDFVDAAILDVVAGVWGDLACTSFGWSSRSDGADPGVLFAGTSNGDAHFLCSGRGALTFRWSSDGLTWIRSASLGRLSPGHAPTTHVPF